jgi:molecular chaperone HtpG
VKFGTKTISVDDPKGEKDDKGEIKQVEKEVDNIINNTKPTWTKAPQDLKEEDYSNFYRELYPTEFNDPIFNIHLNVDYPFNLTGILYFPKLKNNLEVQKNKINLYSNQVFITDNVENIVPEFLTLLHGVIDSPDIPLNVSRSYLQADGNVKKISKYITKKVGDKLNSMFKNDREDFEKKWDDIKVFIEYGMLTEDKFFEKAKDFSLYKNTDGKYATFNEMIDRIKDNQTNKDGKTIILYTHNKDEQDSFINSALEKNYEVLELEGPLVSHLISKLESENSNVQFARVDADTIEKIIEKEDKTPSLLSEDEEKTLKEIVEKKIDDKKFNVQIESLSTTDTPFIITQSEFMRRMKEQQQLSGGMNVFGELSESYNLAVNSNHPIMSQLINESDENKQSELVSQILDLALLSQGLLKGKNLTKFISRSVSMINIKS